MAEPAITLRPLGPDAVATIWTIDRSERIERSYRWADGALELRDDPIDVRGWLPDTPAGATPALLACLEHGGAIMGAYDGARLVGVAALERRTVASRPDLLQLLFLHVSHGYRDQGLGARLVRWALGQAAGWGARGLYISATPTEHTIRFYLGLGSRPLHTPDPQLLAEEPEDIHLELMAER